MEISEFKKLEKIEMNWSDVQHRTGGLGLRRKTRMTMPRWNALRWRHECAVRDLLDGSVQKELDRRNKSILRDLSRKFKYIYDNVKEEVVKDEKGRVKERKMTGTRVEIKKLLKYY